MHKGRLEAFSDAVIAIILTIMVLDLKVSSGHDFSVLKPLLPHFLGYILSFVFLCIYWNNHHHLFQAVKHVNGRILWANAHLLFWLSLVPFTTDWMGDSGFLPLPVALYGAVLLCAAIAYFIVTKVLIASHGKNSVIANALGADLKGKISIVLYAIAIPLAFTNSLYACAIYVLVAITWLVPDRRIENVLENV